MKVLPFVFALGTLGACSALAAPICLNNTLAGYISLGSSGCNVGSATFSGFNTLTAITGAMAAPLSSVNISPFQSGNVVGLDVSFNTTARAGQLFESLFGYTVMAAGLNSSG